MDGNTTLRQVFGLGLGAAACVISLHAQAPSRTPPAFEVASIKENVSASDNASVRAQPGGRVSVSNNSLRNIIRNAYNVQNYQTGLTGAFDVDLTWTPEQGPSGPDGTLPQAPPSSDGVSLFTAVQEQLGLKLDAQRGPVDVLVIESVERPVQD